jgi:putative mRNA 3-end processing factor
LTNGHVIWRDGVHLTATQLWCDAPRRRDLCFISAFDAVEPTRHGQLLATAPTLALLRGQRRGAIADSELGVPVARPFSLGELRLELFATGRALGSAGLRVEGPDLSVIYAGAVNPAGTPLSGDCDVRSADTLIVSGQYGHPRFAFPPIADAIAELASRIEAVTARGGACLLEIESPSIAVELACALAPRRLVGHRRFVSLARTARQLGRPIPPIGGLRKVVRPGQLVLWPRGRTPAPELPRGGEVILCSGAAIDHGGVAISDRADWPSLLGFIEQTRATRVMITGRLEPELAEELRRRGVEASPLGPPEQLILF